MSDLPYVYLDYNASAPLCAEAAAAMSPWLQRVASSPSSAHRSGQRARAAVEQARAQVAELLGVRPQWVYDRLTDMPHFRVGRYVRFRLSDLEEWLEAQRQGPGSGGRQ